jgi:hypothetical protein
MPATDQKIRIAAFNWLGEQVGIHGDVLPRKLLERGFVFEDNRFSLIAPQGIFRPSGENGDGYENVTLYG